MNVAIVIYSQSGTTAQLAKELGAAFTEKGHEVDSTLLRTSGNVSSRTGSFELKAIPDISKNDYVLFGSPVMGFRASRVIMKYLKRVGRLDKKTVLCMVTKGLPFTWTGGKQAIRAMEEELSLSQANLLEGEIIFSREVKDSSLLPGVVSRIVRKFGC